MKERESKVADPVVSVLEEDIFDPSLALAIRDVAKAVQIQICCSFGVCFIASGVGFAWDFCRGEYSDEWNAGGRGSRPGVAC